MPKKIVRRDSTSDDNPFIYTPLKFQKKHGLHTPPVMTKGDMVTFKAYLANPFAFQVHLESVSIVVEGAEFDAYPVLAVTLPPHASCHQILLSGRALATGQIRPKGCLIHALNMICLHLVDGRGLPIENIEDGGASTVNSPTAEFSKAETRCLPREDGPDTATEVRLPLILVCKTIYQHVSVDDAGCHHRRYASTHPLYCWATD